MIVSLICPKHGYQRGDHCHKCEDDIVNEAFYTAKDKLFEFIDINTTGKPVEIRSKRQWKKFMKEHHIHDDRPQRALREEDLESMVNKAHRRRNEEFRQEIRPLFREAMSEKHKWLPKEQFYRRAK